MYSLYMSEQQQSWAEKRPPSLRLAQCEQALGRLGPRRVLSSTDFNHC